MCGFFFNFKQILPYRRKFRKPEQRKISFLLPHNPCYENSGALTFSLLASACSLQSFKLVRYISLLPSAAPSPRGTLPKHFSVLPHSLPANSNTRVSVCVSGGKGCLAWRWWLWNDLRRPWFSVGMKDANLAFLCSSHRWLPPAFLHPTMNWW